MGREPKEWLPASVSGNNGSYVPLNTLMTHASGSYPGETKPYALPVYESSPLSRVLEQYGPGQAWQNNSRSAKNLLTGTLTARLEGSSTPSYLCSVMYFDHAGRLTTVKHKLNTGTEVTLAENTYDELGSLKTNKKNKQSALTSSYVYSIRSWMKSVASPLFSQTLYYNDTYAGNTPRYNGNISAMSWSVAGENRTR